jgi:hypothetical protein
VASLSPALTVTRPSGHAATTLRRLLPIALLMLAAFAIRWPRLGDPAIDYDEQLYLLIGDGLRHGLLPYVDLWDRKPIGLFLIYAATRAFGSDGVLAYQLAATLCAGATAGLVRIMARRAAPPAAAFAAGLGYLLWLLPLGGEGGQSPVFYNLLTALAALAAFRANDSRDPRSVLRLGLLAMAASGLALQVKYVHLPEGVAFGCWFLWRLRVCGLRPGALVVAGAATVAVALLPTLAAIGAYAALGHLDAFWLANFVSIFRRAALPAGTIRYNLGYLAIVTAPLVAALVAATCTAPRTFDRMLTRIWCGAALAGFAMVGNYYPNYALPLMLPAFVAVAPLFARGLPGFAAAGMLIAWPLAVHPPALAATRIDRAGIERLTAAVASYVSPARCLYVYDGPAILYLRSAGCRPTRFVYPDHLTNAAEAPALGVAAAAEEARILASRPAAIVTASMPLGLGFNETDRALARAALARDYVAIAAVPFATRTYYVHVLRALHPQAVPIRDPRAADAL